MAYSQEKSNLRKKKPLRRFWRKYGGLIFLIVLIALGFVGGFIAGTLSSRKHIKNLEEIIEDFNFSDETKKSEEKTKATHQTSNVPIPIIHEQSEPEEVDEKEPDWVTFKCTAYCSCEKCCGKWAKNRPVDKDGEEIVYTASGKRAVQGYTIAADWSVLPKGTKVMIEGYGIYEVMDVGGAIKGNRIDVYFNNHQDALDFGVQNLRVAVIEDEQ